MNQGSAAAAYRDAHFESAPPLKLVQMMYEGALRFLDQASTALEEAAPSRFQERCLRAQAILTELRLALDHGQAPELAERLDSLYLFAEGEINKAIVEESEAGLGAVRDVLVTLLDGWKRLEVAS
jgi:flagellar protein FliS